MQRMRGKGKGVLPLSDTTAEKAIRSIERKSIKPKRDNGYITKHRNNVETNVCKCGKRMSNKYTECYVCRKKEMGLCTLES